MKTLINRSFLYALLSLAGGVFYREFTKWNGFGGRTTLAFVHPHLLTLGALLLLVLALFSRSLPLLEEKRFQIFLKLHTVGLPFMMVMMLVRGVLQVRGTAMTSGMEAAVSGIAGLSHIIVGASLVFLFLALKGALLKETREQKPNT